MGFIVALFVISSFLGVDGIRFTKEDTQLEKQLKPNITTIKTEYGDVYDCVDIYKQPAFDHPALTDHKIQMRPVRNLEDMLVQAQPKKAPFGVNSIKIGLEKGCPPGTVPIQRMTQEHVTRSKLTSQKLNFSSKIWNHGLEFAGIVSSKGPGKEYHGGSGDISIHNPTVGPHQFSSAMLSIESGEGSNLNQIQVGWTVNPELYHDGRTRMYTSWTRDNHQSTGCYNILCPGFVLVNNQIPLDFAFPEISSPDGKQFEMAFSVTHEPSARKWWLHVNEDKDVVGYWPDVIFSANGLSHAADTLRWGGQVFTPLSDDESPPMGSGVFENGRYDRTCYIREVVVANGSFKFEIPDESSIQVAESRCYFEADQSYKDEHWKYSFLFGGTGGKDEVTCLY